MRIYLDNNATTEVHPRVLETYMRLLRDVHGNSSSVHHEGQLARKTLEEAREAVATLISAAPNEVVFTSGGTESNNAALAGAVARRDKFCSVVTTAIEHPAVLEVARRIGSRGHEVTFVRCGSDGRVVPEEVIAAITGATGLVSVMLANNETGVIQDIAEIGAFCRARGIHFHCDAVQAIGKVPVNVSELNVDTLSLSGHKFHAPKGIGALYVRTGVILEPYMVGGAQERRRRAGTENPPLAGALAEAARLFMESPPQETVAQMRDAMEREILARISGAAVNGAAAPRLPNTSSLRLPDSDAEGIVIALDLAGFAISAGAACASGRVEPSHVLRQMGLSDSEARSSIRVSLSRRTRHEEVTRFVDALAEVVARSRRIAATKAEGAPA